MDSEVFTQYLDVSLTDVGIDNKITNKGFLRLMQDTANANSELLRMWYM